MFRQSFVGPLEQRTVQYIVGCTLSKFSLCHPDGVFCTLVYLVLCRQNRVHFLTCNISSLAWFTWKQM